MRGDRLWKAGFLICTIIFIVVAGGRSLAQSSADDDIHISAVAEFYALHAYPHLKGHKALAVGPGGYWADAWGKASAGSATGDALGRCNAGLRTSSYKSLARRKCVLFDVDGKRTGKAKPIGIPFGTAAQGPDTPYEKGNSWEPIVKARRGNLLLLHGCNRQNGTINGWLSSWISFYRAIGFRVIKPDSFAEPRDREVCADPGEDGIDAQTRNVKLRVAQTLRTIATLRRKYPGEPIYIHGHSEGGYVAQALGEKLAGIIVTGAPCGFGSASAYWVGEGTPILVIAGTKDEFVINGSSAKKLSAYCKTVRGPGRLTTVSVRGLGHFAAIWRPEVSEAVAKFLQVPDIRISRRASDGVPFPLSGIEAIKYTQAKPPKALAADGRGNWAWDSVETEFDSEEAALFLCDHIRGHNLFADRLYRHACVLVDVNGKRLVK